MVQFYNETVWTIKINAKIWLGTLVCNLLIWWYIIWFILSHIMGVQSILVGNETWISHSLAQKKNETTFTVDCLMIINILLLFITL